MNTQTGVLILIIGILILGGVYFLGGSLFGPQTEAVTLYYYNPEQDVDEAGNVLCSKKGLVGVEREVEVQGTREETIEKTINMLIRGELTEEELGRGVRTEFPLTDFELEEGVLENSTLTLTFSDPLNRTSGGACRVGILWYQIEETALQFPEVETVNFLPEELFQP